MLQSRPGHVIAAHLVYSWQLIDPCGTNPKQKKNEYYEKFGTPALYIQNSVMRCESQIVNFQRTIKYALVPDPEPATAIPDKEYAVSLTKLTSQQRADHAAAVTLKLTIKYDYDGCNKPPVAPTQTNHYLKFSAVTLDPNQNNKITWTLPGNPEKHSG